MDSLPIMDAKIEQALGEKADPQELFDYIYAVLYSTSYRERYREFLKIDFPHVPYPASPSRYHELSRLGAALRRLHLMQGADGWPTAVTYPVAGSNEVTQPRYAGGATLLSPTHPAEGADYGARTFLSSPCAEEAEEQGTATTGMSLPHDGRVYINATQYFGGVSEAAWSFFIGGYQPAQKWLKDRKGRALTFADIRHYEQIIFALTETQRIMAEIDAQGG